LSQRSFGILLLPTIGSRIAEGGSVDLLWEMESTLFTRRITIYYTHFAKEFETMPFGSP
jgi:hypothetical protein